MTKLQHATILIDALTLALARIRKTEPLSDDAKKNATRLLLLAAKQNEILKAAAKTPPVTY